MKIGSPKEVLDQEYRVGLTPSSAASLVGLGHQVFLETKAGLGSGFSDELYAQAGAKILPNAEAVYREASLIIKVKQPLPIDLKYLQAKHTLFTFLHLAAGGSLAQELCSIGLTAYAYETIEAEDKSLPALLPMSEIAGRMSVQIGAHLLEKAQGGSGILLSGVPGVSKGRIVILGGGVAGSQAARQAIGIGAETVIFEKSAKRLRELDELFGGRASILASNPSSIAHQVERADLVIGAVLIPGKLAPILVSKELIGTMKTGSALIDIAIDQGGCIEGMKTTTHSEPVFADQGILHYGVANMPGAVPRTSTIALNNATLPYITQLASLEGEIFDDFHGGLNISAGQVLHPEVKEALAS